MNKHDEMDETSSHESDVVVMEERVEKIRKRGSMKEVPPPKIMQTEDREDDKQADNNDNQQPLTPSKIMELWKLVDTK